MPTLQTNVTTHNPDTGETQTFPKGMAQSDLPDWARKTITNESVWEEPEVSNMPTPGPSQSVPFDPESEEALKKALIGGDSTFGSGSFSSRKAGQVKALAAAHGLGDLATQDEAIAALDAAGITPDTPEPVPTSTDTNVEP